MEKRCKRENSSQHLSKEEAAKEIVHRPLIALPTLLLFLVSLGGWIVSLACGSYHLAVWPTWLCLLVSISTQFAMFTVAHDAAHHAISKIRWLNESTGRLAFLFLGPLSIATFEAFRWLHLQHHKYTNDPNRDPDHYVASGPAWQSPLRWGSMEVHYYRSFFRNWNKLSTTLKRTVIMEGGFLLICFVFLFYHYPGESFWHWILPSRVVIFLLAFSFDFLPHYPHKIQIFQDRFRTTSLLLFPLQPLFSLLLLYQDYHVVHHLYPTIPFYRYSFAWDKKKVELHDKIPVRKCFAFLQ